MRKEPPLQKDHQRTFIYPGTVRLYIPKWITFYKNKIYKGNDQSNSFPSLVMT